MKKWIRRASLLTVGVSLIATSAYAGQGSASIEGFNGFSGIPALQLHPWGSSKNPDTVPDSALSDDTLVIKFTKPLSPSEHRMAGGTLIKQFSDLHYSVVKIRDKKNLDQTIEKYRKFSNVLAVTPSAVYKPLSVGDPKIAEQYQIDQLHLDKAQALAGNNPVTVAVIDQGIDVNHPDLKGRLLPSYNAVTPMNQGTPDFHGTHVAGIIAADKGNGIGGYGVNPKAKILPIDVFDRSYGASDFSIAQGILYAVDKGAKVINMSLGSPMPSPLIEDAIKKALEKNVTIVAAAGNAGDDTLNYPAAYEGVISVGSVNKEKKLSSFSTYGTSVDVVAPGDEIYSTIYEYERKSSYRKLSGTSMAAPMVTGAASLLLSKYPKLTPYQVEYILEHTAEDLGDKGFDVKYGNGLINPAAALQFNVKKIPDIVNQTWSKQELMSDAVPVSVKGKLELKANLLKPYEEKWYKTDIQKGESLQFVLDGAAQFDYKLMLQLYSNNDKMLADVNKVREGKKEGKLFTAPFSGTLFFGVKDVNGSYDDSGRALSNFKLQVEKSAGLPDAESSIVKPIDVELPFSNKGQTNYLDGENGEDDFYRFSVKEPQAISINLSDIPGVDTSVSVYIADQIFPPDMNTLPSEEQQAILDRLLSGETKIDPAFYANKGSYSDGESLGFSASPGTQYIVKVSNKNDVGMNNYFLNKGLMNNDQKPEPSIIPYSLDIQGKILPPDEDMFPAGGPEDDKGAGKEAGDEGQPDFIQMLKDGAQPYEMGSDGRGSLQMQEDEDWFSVTASETGIYEFDFAQEGFSVPVMEMYRIQEDKDENGKPVQYLAQIGSNVKYDWSSAKVNPALYTGLKKGENYYIKINADMYNGNMSFDPYQFSSKLLFKNPQDAYEDNDKLEHVANMPSGLIEGNFAMPYDQDVFYIRSDKSQIYGVTFKRKNVDEKWLSKYPKDLVSPFFGMLAIAEDTNKNRKLDDSEYDRVQIIDHGAFSGSTFGSFKMEKNKNYIVIVTGYVDGPIPLTLWPYQLKVAPVNQLDEDRHSVVKNNTPSKPLPLKTAGKNQLKATGYLNAGVPYGDEDWYVLKLSKNASGKIELGAGTEVDGVISLYKDGKLVSRADYYPEGDKEILPFNLKKGTYYIKVRDTNGNTTLDPYTVTVKYQ